MKDLQTPPTVAPRMDVPKKTWTNNPLGSKARPELEGPRARVESRSQRVLRRMDTARDIDYRFWTHVGWEGVLLLLVMIVFAAGNGYIVYTYTHQFTRFSRPLVFVFVVLGIIALSSVVEGLYKWKSLALMYSRRIVHNQTKRHSGGCYGAVKRQYSKTQISGKYYLVKMYFTEIVESLNQLRNLFEIYFCSLPIQVSSGFCFVMFMDCCIRSFYMSRKNTPSRRYRQINIDVAMDCGSMAFPLLFLYVVYKVPISLTDLFWIICMPCVCLIMKARSLFRENVNLHSVKQLNAHLPDVETRLEGIAIMQQECIPLKVRYGLITYFCLYGLFVSIAGLFHVIMLYNFGGLCHASLWQACDLKVPFCRKTFEPSCDCAVLRASPHNWTVLPGEIDEMRSLKVAKIAHGPLEDLQNMENLELIRRLNLEFNSLSAVSSKVGGRELISVQLNNNKLTELPLSLWGNPSVALLKIENNMISKIPDEIKNAETLHTFFAANNSVHEWPLRLPVNALYTVTLDGNQLESIPPEVGALRSLRFLQINNNKIDYIAKEIGSLKSLEMFDLRNNSVASLEGFEELHSLTELYLRGNPICDTLASSASAEIKAFVEAFEEEGMGCKKQCSPYCQDIQITLGQCFRECNSAECKFSGGFC